MTDDTPTAAADAATLSVQIANQIVNIANNHIEDGFPHDAVAAGLRHAAANFSAFAFYRDGGGASPEAIVEEFIGTLEFYLDRHQPKADSANLQQLIEIAKNEI